MSNRELEEEFENTFGFSADEVDCDYDNMEDLLWREQSSIYKKTQPKNNNANKNSKQGCYIATSVYGSYDCPQVWTLRRYRDNKLKKYFFGRLFIKIYYALSPKMVEKFGRSAWFNKFFLRVLNKYVSYLLQKGYENTPYID